MNDPLSPPSVVAKCIAESCLALPKIQETMSLIYGRYDREKALLWMCEEIGELIQAIRKGKNSSEIAGEYGDFLVWALCLSSILELDLAEVVGVAARKEVARQLSSYGKLKYWTPPLDPEHEPAVR